MRRRAERRRMGRGRKKVLRLLVLVLVLVLVLLVLGLVAGGGVLVITAAAMVDGGYLKGRLGRLWSIFTVVEESIPRSQ